MAPKANQGCKYFPLCDHPGAFNSESRRLVSYKEWPPDHPVSPSRLAQAGFVYRGQADEVSCHFCQFTKRGWTRGDKPEQVHKNGSPGCPLYDDNDNNPFRGPSNVPIPVVNVRGNPRLIFAASGDAHPQPADPSSTPQQTDDDADDDSAVDLEAHHVLQDIGVRLRRRRPRRQSVGDEKYPGYWSLKKRMASFRWRGFPEHLVSPLCLSHLGFFSAGIGDLVICFCCGLMLDTWQAPDDPAIEHARHCPSCRHLLAIKGHHFVNTVQNELAVIGHAN